MTDLPQDLADTLTRRRAYSPAKIRSSYNRLPGTPDDHAVTLDLNGTIAIRAKTYEAERPTELILTNSRRTGEDVRISNDLHGNPAKQRNCHVNRLTRFGPTRLGKMATRAM